MIQPSDIHTLTEFKRDSTRLLRCLEESGRPQVITVDGRPRVVILSVEGFERLSLLAGKGSLGGELPTAGSTDAAASAPSAAAGQGDEHAAVRLREAFELLALAHALLEQRVRREDPSATEAEVESLLLARKAQAAGGEEVPGHLEFSAERLRKLLQ